MSISYLQVRNGNYYLRLRTPADLLEVFPQREIVKTLKTKDLKTAKVSVLPYLQGISKTFALLRSGYIQSEQATKSLSELLCVKSIGEPKEPLKASHGSNTKTIMLSTVVSSFVMEKEREWGVKTKMEAQGVYRLIIDLLGDVPVQEINRPMVRELRSNLLKLPPNLYKVYKGKAPLQLLDMKHEKTMSIATVNKQMSFLYALLNFSMKEGHRTDNPASEMQLKQNRKQSEERKAYDIEEIKLIIKGLPRADTVHLERYWIPLLCMYQGMRLDEACQLYKDDVKKVDGVWCIDINDEKDKKLKNSSSRRVIPVHPILISLGFIRYCEGCVTKRLWNNLTWRATGGYSNAVGQWFRRFNRDSITDDPQKTLHSLRHSFADHLKQKLVDKSLVAALMGHSEGSMTFGRYGKEYKPEVLLEVVKKVDYGLNIK